MSKDKKPQRTKGNVKAASSYKAAEVLSEYGLSSSAGFVGFGDGQDSSEDLHSDFRILFRKLSKKDAITKSKALKDLVVSIGQHEENEVLKAWASWPKLYAKLALDEDVTVRTEAHKSMGAFALKLNKLITSRFKELMPYWTIGQCDSYNAVNMAARNSFFTTFPSLETRKQAFAFCKLEMIKEYASILQNIEKYKSLIDNNNPDTKDAWPATESRIFVCTLKSISKLLNELKEENIESIRDLLKSSFLENNLKFWHLAKSRADEVVKNWLQLLFTMISKLPEEMENYTTNFAPILLNLMEKRAHLNFSGCKEALNCILLVLDKFPDHFWKSVNFQKAFLPKVLSILKKIGDPKSGFDFYGPYLLPLLAKMMENEMAGCKVDLALRFIDTFHDSIVNSAGAETKSDLNESTFGTYLDCVKFISGKFWENDTVLDRLFIQLIATTEFIIGKNQSKLINPTVSTFAVLFAQMEKYFTTKNPALCADLQQKVQNFEWKIHQFILDFSFSTLWCDFVLKMAKTMEKSSLEFTTRIYRSIYEHMIKKDEFNPVEMGQFLNVWSQRLKNRDFLDFLSKNGTKCEEFCEKLRSIMKEAVLDCKTNKNEAHPVVKYGLRCGLQLAEELGPEKLIELIMDKELLETPIHQYTLLEELSQLDPLQSTNCKVVYNLPQFLSCLENCFVEMLKSSPAVVNKEKMEISFDWEIFSHFLTLKDENGLMIVPISFLNRIFDKIVTKFEGKSVNQENLVKSLDFVVNLCQTVFDVHEEIHTSNVIDRLLPNLFTIFIGSHIDDAIKLKMAHLIGLIVKKNGENCIKLTGLLFDRLKTPDMNCKEITTMGSSIALLLNETKMNNATFFIPATLQLNIIFEKLLFTYDWFFICSVQNLCPCQKIPSLQQPDAKWMENLAITLQYCLYFTILCKNVVSQLDLAILAKCQTYSLATLIYLQQMKQHWKLVSVVKFTKCQEMDEMVEKLKQDFGVVFFGPKNIEKDDLEVLFETIISSNGLLDFIFPFVVNYYYEDNGSELIIDYLTENMSNFSDSLQLLATPFLRKFNYQNLEATDSISDVTRKFCKLSQLENNTECKFETKSRMLSEFAMVQQGAIGQKLLLGSTFQQPIDLEIINLNLAVIQFLYSTVNFLDQFSVDQADTLFCSLLGWMQTISEYVPLSESECNDDSTRIFVVINILRLFKRVHNNVTVLKAENSLEQKRFINDWFEFFLEPCQLTVLKLYTLHFSENVNPYIKLELADCLQYCEAAKILEYLKMNLLLSPELDSLSYPENYQSILLNVSPFLNCKDRIGQIAAFNILKKIVPSMYEFEKAKIEDDSVEKDTYQENLLPSYLTSNLELVDQFSDHLYQSISNQSIKSQILAYLLGYKVLIGFFSEAVRVEHRPRYSNFMASQGHFKRLLIFVFELLTLTDQRRSGNLGQKVEKKTKIDQLFSEMDSDSQHSLDVVVEKSFFDQQPDLSASGETTVSELTRLACNVYYELLRLFPAAIRQWWNNAERKLKNQAERFTSKFVSPMICAYELQTVAKSQKKYGKMTLSVRTNAREIVANYKLEDLNMELVIILPQSYPLQPVSVEAVERVGVAKDKWRKWMLQLTVFLTHQNGSILDGLLLWKRCVDKHLDGVDECMICMMAVHGSSYQLPKITCRQCKKKFHAACLYKWFDTSSKSSCPMCRTDFVN